MKVLMGTDGSVHASSAMLSASHFLRRNDLHVDVLCVYPKPAAHTLDVALRAHQERVTRPAQRTLDDARRILSLSHLSSEGILKVGSPAECLLANAGDYDLTVVGAYGNHDRGQPGLGPVSSRLLQLSGANVLIGRELVNEDNFRVLIALDSSDSSLSAVRTLVKLCDLSSLEITVMHVIETPWSSFYRAQSSQNDADSGELSEYGHQLEGELRRLGDEAIKRAVRYLEGHGIAVSTIIEEGDPSLELCSYAEEGGYDLIVCGASGVSDVKHALMGSVSLKLAWNAPCSVLIVRRPIE